ncbi:MAG: putative Ig domain-containing protein, partial [Nanoarchaeota archaeon]|nr:putative Ig domain-containing protein [Nanoarchaeota archaeon]
DSAVYVHWINITVTDSQGGKDSVVINFTVNNVPDIPYFYNISNMTAWANAPFWYQIEARDDDNATQFGETLNYWDNSSLFNISNSTGIISFTPTNVQNGTYWINISVNDSTDNWVTTIINFTIYVNYAPQYNGSLEFNMTEGYLFEVNLSLNTSDADGNSFTFSDNASWFDISSTGFISVTANDSFVGTNWVAINITDQYGALSEYVFNFTVVNENDAPVLSTISNVSDAPEGVLLSFDVDATDDDLFIPNTWEYLTFRINYSGNGMYINPSTGEFSWTPSGTQNGTYWVNFTVNDSTGNEDSQIIFINVTDAAFPPRFLDSEIFFCTSREAIEDENFASCIIWACDNDTGSILKIAANYSWFNSNINNSNLIAVWYTGYGYCVNTTLNFTPTYTEVGNYTVLLNVTDNTGAYVNLSLGFNISSKNDAPQIATIPTQNLQVNVEYNYNLSANVTDEENDAINFFANTTLFLFNVTINKTTGILTGTPNLTMVGTYYVNFTVNDTYGAESSRVIKFVISENFAPSCSSFLAVTPSKTITSAPDNFNISENQSTGSFIVTCSDLESNSFTYQWFWNGTLNYTKLHPSGNTWNYTANFLDAGTVNITLKVNDTATNFNIYYWNVTIFDLNAPPMMYSNIPNITKMPTWLSSSAWYKNRNTYVNLSNYFFDYDNENLTFEWFRYAINENFNDNNFNRVNLSWTFSGNWFLINDTSNNPALKQNITSGLKIANEKTYIDITEVKAKIKLYSGGVAGFCFGNSSCTGTVRKVFLNLTDNTTNLEYSVGSSVDTFNNSYSLSLSNTSYVWLKSVFKGNNTLVYVSAEGAYWNMSYNMSVNLNASSSTFSLFTINAEAVFDDVVLKDPDLKNVSVTYTEEGNKLTFTPNTGWSGDLLMAVAVFDGKNTTDSNLFNLHIDDVSEPAPVVITQTTTSSSTSRVTQVASLNIIVPSLISLTPLSKTIIPVILQNTGDLNLNILDLIAYSNQSALTLTLEQANWTILSVGQSVNSNRQYSVKLQELWF